MNRPTYPNRNMQVKKLLHVIFFDNTQKLIISLISRCTLLFCMIWKFGRENVYYLFGHASMIHEQGKACKEKNIVFVIGDESSWILISLITPQNCSPTNSPSFSIYINLSPFPLYTPSRFTYSKERNQKWVHHRQT